MRPLHSPCFPRRPIDHNVMAFLAQRVNLLTDETDQALQMARASDLWLPVGHKLDTGHIVAVHGNSEHPAESYRGRHGGYKVPSHVQAHCHPRQLQGARCQSNMTQMRCVGNAPHLLQDVVRLGMFVSNDAYMHHRRRRRVPCGAVAKEDQVGRCILPRRARACPPPASPWTGWSPKSGA